MIRPLAAKRFGWGEQPLMLPVNVLRYGREEELPDSIPLRAGPLSLLFSEGGLRYLRVDGQEAVRALFVAVRDENWGTVPNQKSNLRIGRTERDFDIAYDAENRQGAIHFRWSARISGNECGVVLFTMRGKAINTFRRNRIGICVLHPVPECAGLPCRVEHTDGSVEAGMFPLHIAPHQPFRDMRAISHELPCGVNVEARFGGEVFEMEDQRNWTDASSKTYRTPLHLPFPVEVAAATEISQDVRITLSGMPKRAPSVRRGSSQSAVLISIGRDARRLPALGTSAASPLRPLTAAQLTRLDALRLAHLRVDFGWLVFHKAEKSTSARWVMLARERLRRYGAAIPIVSGTNAYFAELNRARPDTSLVNGVCFSINPQVHAFDNTSLVETLTAQNPTIVIWPLCLTAGSIVTAGSAALLLNKNRALPLFAGTNSPAGHRVAASLIGVICFGSFLLYGSAATALGSLGHRRLAAVHVEESHHLQLAGLAYGRVGGCPPQAYRYSIGGIGLLILAITIISGGGGSA